MTRQEKIFKLLKEYKGIKVRIITMFYKPYCTEKRTFYGTLKSFDEEMVFITHNGVLIPIKTENIVDVKNI